MKFFPNLAKGLRTLFGVMRIFVLVAVIAWMLLFLFGGVLRGEQRPGPLLSVGTVTIDASPNPFAAPTLGAVGVSHLRGTLQIDWFNAGPEALKLMRCTLIPMILMSALFSWFFLGHLRSVCSNLERGEVFTDANFSAVRSLAFTMIVYAGAAALVRIWGQWLINGYLRTHANLGSSMSGSINYSLHYAGETYVDLLRLVILGLLVLLMSEAFRQGVQLKAENDLTV